MTAPSTPEDDVLLTEDQVANILAVSVRTVQHWRTKKMGPPVTALGRLIRYSRRALMEWIKSRTRT